MTTSCDSACSENEGDFASAPVGKRIMLVEDDPGLRALFRLVLHTRGYHVLTAEDGEVAVDTLDRSRNDIDLLIADVCLPKVGGVEMIERMKRGGAMPPVLICSGAVEYDVEEELRKTGAIWFLPKPFHNREMLEQIERILSAASAGPS